MSITEDELLDRLASAGVTVETVDCAPLWGYWDHRRRVVGLRRGLTAGQRLATLAHEAVHVERGDSGPQSAAVEARINRRVARALISEAAYREAEVSGATTPGAIASRLDVPVWLVEAFRAGLDRNFSIA